LNFFNERNGIPEKKSPQGNYGFGEIHDHLVAARSDVRPTLAPDEVIQSARRGIITDNENHLRATKDLEIIR
jgi:hypothetical protein